MKAKDIFTIVFFLFVITYCATPNAKDSVITNNIQLIEVKTKSKKKKTKKQKKNFLKQEIQNQSTEI